MERTTVELAKAGGVGGMGFYEKSKCYRVGSIAIVKQSGKFRWYMCHFDTGLQLPYAYARNLKEAESVASAVDKAIDWDTIRRTGDIGRPAGLTRDKGKKVKETLQTFSFLNVHD